MTLRSRIDLATADRIAGWAQDQAMPGVPVALLIRVDEVVVARLRADLARPDLRAAGIGDGSHGFVFTPNGLTRGGQHVIALQRESDQAHLQGSPILVRPDGVLLPSSGDDQVAPLRGRIDLATRERLHGWAQDPTCPDTPVSLLVTADDVLLARVLADRPRPDLQTAGFGRGRHGFEIGLKGLSPLSPHVIAVRREADGAHLENSPTLLPASAEIDAAFRTQWAALLADTADAATLAARLGFLAEQAEILLQQRADRRSRRGDRLALRQIKWRWTDPHGGEAVADHPVSPRALVIDERVPAPARDAGSNALLSHMQALRRLGYDISFVAADMAGDRAGVLEAAGIACCCAPWHGSVEEVLRREADSFDLVYLHRGSIAARYIGLVRFHQRRARVVYSVADLQHLRLARQAKAENRPELLAQARAMQNHELRAAAAANAVITHSTFEANLIRQHLPQAKIHVVPWSIPVRQTAVPFARRRGLAFIGHFAHAPNLDAAKWLMNEIMPRVRASHPAINCLLAGSDMPPDLRSSVPAIQTLGAVRCLSTVFDRVRLTVAPMNFGAGIKGKVLESLAAGIPCVCTPVAAEGLELPPVLQTLIGADMTALVAAIIRLHEDMAFNAECSKAGLDYITTALSESRIDALMRDVAA